MQTYQIFIISILSMFSLEWLTYIQYNNNISIHKVQKVTTAEPNNIKWQLTESMRFHLHCSSLSIPFHSCLTSQFPGVTAG